MASAAEAARKRAGIVGEAAQGSSGRRGLMSVPAAEEIEEMPDFPARPTSGTFNPQMVMMMAHGKGSDSSLNSANGSDQASKSARTSGRSAESEYTQATRSTIRSTDSFGSYVGGSAEESSNLPAAIKLTGWLNKQNPRGLFSKGWKKRWFELDATTLTYYDNVGGQQLRIVHVANIKSVKRIDSKGRDHAFEVATNIFEKDGTPRIFLLQADDEGLASQWVHAIENNSGRYRRRSRKSGSFHIDSDENEDKRVSKESVAANSDNSRDSRESGGRISPASSVKSSQSQDQIDEDERQAAYDDEEIELDKLHGLGEDSDASGYSSSMSYRSLTSPAAGKNTSLANLMNLRRLSNSVTSASTQMVKKMVSRNKLRFEEDGFSLDLAYITPRLIAMGFPSEGVEGSYRNHISDVYRFFETRHADKYLIFNLCSERSYDPAKFHHRVECFPFDDHNPPPFEMMRPLCVTVQRWLDEDPENVVAIHCKAGKGRTGVMVVSCLLHLNQYTTAAEALRFYGGKRTSDGNGVTIRSQRRYCHYFEQNLNMTRPLQTLKCVSFKLYDPPVGFAAVVVRIRNGKANLTFQTSLNPISVAGLEVTRSCSVDSTGEPGQTDKRFPTSVVSVECGNVELAGDVHITLGFRSKAGSTSWMPMMGQADGEALISHFWFHTSFVEDNCLNLLPEDFDGAPRKDKKHEKFRPSFGVGLKFQQSADPKFRVHHPDSGLRGAIMADITRAPSSGAKTSKKILMDGGSFRVAREELQLDSEAVSTQEMSDLMLSAKMNKALKMAERNGDNPLNEELESDEDDGTVELESCGQAIVLYDYEAAEGMDDQDATKYLTLQTNDVVTILRKDDGGWWLGILNREVGWFPARYCVEIAGQFRKPLEEEALSV